jgi:hypothetical protein
MKAASFGGHMKNWSQLLQMLVSFSNPRSLAVQILLIVSVAVAQGIGSKFMVKPLPLAGC